MSLARAFEKISTTTLLAVALAPLLWSMIVPRAALAYPFGGQASLVHVCYNETIYVVLGPPRGGIFVWTPTTQTYQFGAPSHAGQWLLGLAGTPYECLYNVSPIDVRSADTIIMMGSSQ